MTTCQQVVKRVAFSVWYEYLTLVFLVAAVLFVMCVVSDPPPAAENVGWAIFAVFATQLGIKVFAEGWNSPSTWRNPWTLYDLVLLLIQLYFLIRQQELWMVFVSFRVFVGVKVLRFAKGIRVLVLAIFGSLKVVMSFAITLALVITPFAIFSTVSIGRNPDFSSGTNSTEEEIAQAVETQQLWGTFGRSALTWFEIATLNWGDCTRPYIYHTPALAIPFLLYLMIVGFGISNIFITIIGSKFEEELEIEEVTSNNETQADAIQEVELKPDVHNRELLDKILAGECEPESVYQPGLQLSNNDLAYLMLMSTRSKAPKPASKPPDA